MHADNEFAASAARAWRRKARNAIVAIALVAVFVQYFGVPQVRATSRHASLRLVRPSEPVWVLARDAAVFVWSQVSKEFQP